MRYKLRASSQRPFSSSVHRAKDVGIQGAGGKQGKAFTWAALETAGREGHDVHAIVRDEAQYRQDSRINDGNRQAVLADDPNLRITSDPHALSPDDSIFVNAVSAGGLGSTLGQLPRGSKVLMTQNGVDLMEGNRKDLELAYGISVVVTASDGERGVTVKPGGKLQVGADNPFLKHVLQAFDKQGVFNLEVVDDINATKWEKIALNSALNAPATLFGKNLGQFLELMKEDSRYAKLIAGLTKEVCDVAAALKVSVRPVNKVLDTIHGVMDENKRHPTSMQNHFLEGKELELPVLNEGVSKVAGDVKIATPLNNVIVEKMRVYEALRKEHGASPDFHVRHATEVAAVTEEVLQAAASLY
jgi:2-dehydropantoate 2-reductase